MKEYDDKVKPAVQWQENIQKSLRLKQVLQDIYDEKYLQSLDLTERQVKAILYVKEKGKITNSDYQTLTDVSRETATRDLKELMDKQLIKSSGQKGAGAFYTLH